MKYVKDGVFNIDKVKNDIETTEDLYELLVKFGNIYSEVLSDNNQMTMILKLDLCTQFTSQTYNKIIEIIYRNILT